MCSHLFPYHVLVNKGGFNPIGPHGSEALYLHMILQEMSLTNTSYQAYMGLDCKFAPKYISMIRLMTSLLRHPESDVSREDKEGRTPNDLCIELKEKFPRILFVHLLKILAEHRLLHKMRFMLWFAHLRR